VLMYGVVKSLLARREGPPIPAFFRCVLDRHFGEIFISISH
jgi:hypothetical protein